MYVVKNDNGEFSDACGTFGWWGYLISGYDAQKVADNLAENNGGHVVELIEKPEPVVVSEEEAEMLEQAKQNTNPFYILWWNNTTVTNDHNQQERLMRAYVNGWTAKKPKRFALPMDGTELADGTVAYAALDHTGVWTIKGYAEKQSTVAFHSTVTQADIDAAPDWVKAIKPVEVTDDEQ
jgi:hypothetical protein